MKCQVCGEKEAITNNITLLAKNTLASYKVCATCNNGYAEPYNFLLDFVPLDWEETFTDYGKSIIYTSLLMAGKSEETFLQDLKNKND